MSFDLFSRIDFSFSKLSFLKILIWIFRLIILINLVFFNSKSFLYRTIVVIDDVIFSKFSKKISYFVKLNWSLITLFEIILLRKLTGLFPYVFGWTSHILIILMFSLILWLTIKISFLIFDKISFFSHLVPQGTPLVLGMFLRIIELIRKFIRPLTLSLRLGINITTGHILLGLIRIIGVQTKFNIFLILFGSFYFLFELFVMFIQAVVFTLLLSQYSEETLI